MTYCVECGKSPADRAHIKSKGSGGDHLGLGEMNFIYLCRQHHALQHQIGFPEFATRHHRVMDELKRKGWVVAVVLGQRRVIREADQS